MLCRQPVPSPLRAIAVTCACKQSARLVYCAGSVSFNFERKGIVFVGSSASEDDALEAAMNAGAEDVQAVRNEEEQLEGHKASMAAIPSPELNITAHLGVNLAASCLWRGIM